MPLMSGLLRALGNDRAVANVQAVLEARQREAWLVAGVARRVELRAAEAASLQHVLGNGAGARAVA